MLSHLLQVDWMPPAGCNVLMVDYRGYGRSTGECRAGNDDWQQVNTGGRGLALLPRYGEATVISRSLATSAC
jgi:pimeloyl-ACP methyl ester carboxylesterase